ncbi:MAG: YybH family protein [Rhodospirillales bacterium]
MKLYLYSALLLSLAFAPVHRAAAAAPPAKAEDMAAIKALFDKHLAAFNAGDSAAVAALFTDKGALIPPDRQPLGGKEVIRYGLRIAFGLYSAKVTPEAAEIDVSGDLAYAWRKYSLTITDKTAGEQRDLVATWLDILKRQPDGSWKIHLEMVSADKPLPTGDQ